MALFLKTCLNVFILFRSLIDRPVFTRFLSPGCDVFSLDRDGGHVPITVSRVLPGTVRSFPHFHSAMEPTLKNDFNLTVRRIQPDLWIVQSSGVVQCGNPICCVLMSTM